MSYYVSQIGRIVSHRPTEDALVERWCPETNTFHLPHGECTITLEKVTMIRGFQTDGLSVIGSTDHSTSGYDCKDIDGPLTLLLVWAWIRMPTIWPFPVDTSFPLAHKWNDYQPTTEHYKNWTTSNVKRRLDNLPPDGFVWNAYSPNWVASHVILFDINNGANLWSATVPLICFEAAKWHPTDRIRRQYSFYQDPQSKL
ncbi:uncharacterized protein DS421_17g581780 [Arachis hypogaea]|nr:uncharacterized protein DS421_17g581780 [Arachis hypogaea]